MGKEQFCNNKNYPPFNGVPCKEGEILVPFFVGSDERSMLEDSGLIPANIIPLRFPHTSKRIPTAFIQALPEQEEVSKKYYYRQVHIYLDGENEHLPIINPCPDRHQCPEGSRCPDLDQCPKGKKLPKRWEKLSLNKILGDIQKDEAIAHDPTGIPGFEDTLIDEIDIWDLIMEVSQENPRYGDILIALHHGHKKITIWKTILPEYSRSSAYDIIAKVAKKASTLYNQKHHR